MFYTDVTNGVLLLNAFSISDISEKIKSNPEHTRRVCTELFCKNKLARKKVLKADGLIIYISKILFLNKKLR